MQGSIAKISRFGDSVYPNSFNRFLNENNKLFIDHDYKNNNTNNNNNNSNSNSNNIENKINFFSNVSCMAVRPPIINLNNLNNFNKNSTSIKNTHNDLNDNNTDNESKQITSNYATSTSSAGLLLVGREDATVDLFQLDIDFPVYSWNIANFISNKNTSNNTSNSSSNNELRNVKIVYLKWCPLRASVFFVVDSNLNIFLFDLLIDQYKPIFIDSLLDNNNNNNNNNKFNGDNVDFNFNSIDISIIKNSNNVNYFNLIFIDNTDKNEKNLSKKVKIRKLNKTLIENYNNNNNKNNNNNAKNNKVVQQNMNIYEEEAMFRNLLEKLATTVMPQITTVYGNNNNNNNKK
jgi:hypothetical protein